MQKKLRTYIHTHALIQTYEENKYVYPQKEHQST